MTESNSDAEPLTSQDKWEYFCDVSYYHQWAVRPIGDKLFSSQKLFHVPSMEEADALAALLNKLEANQIKLDAFEAINKPKVSFREL